MKPRAVPYMRPSQGSGSGASGLPSHGAADRVTRWGVAVGLLALAAWIAFRLHTGIVIEDALITFRYAQNIALGNGFVYNIGERVLGTTTPLFTLVLAALGALFGVDHIPAIAVALMVPAGLAAGWLTFLALRRLNLPRWLPVFFLAAFLLNFNVIWAMVGGLETPLVLLLMAASFLMLVSRRSTWAAVFAALLVLTRVDGAIWAAGVFALILLTDRRAFARAALIGALILLPWVTFASGYFGDPVPHTVAAKATIGQEGDLSTGTGAASYVGWWLLHVSRISPFGRLIGIVLFLLGGWAVFRRYRSPGLLWLFLFPFVFLAAYYLGRAPKFPWYLVPLIWSGVMLGSLGLWEAGRIVFEVLPGPMRRPAVLHAALAAFFVVYGAAMLNRGLVTTAFHRRWQLEENHVRMPLGLWLRENASPGATAAMEAIGYQGYYSGLRVIDFAGLISPEVVRLYRRTESNAAVMHSILVNRRPEFVVLRAYEPARNQSFLGGRLFDAEDQRAHFQNNYEVAAEFHPRDPAFENMLFNLVVYRRISGM